MKLSVSNLAFPIEKRPATYRLLAAAGLHGVEVAPTRVQPWEDMSARAGEEERSVIEDAGLQVSSLQAIFYGLPSLQLLGDSAAFESMCEHTARLGEYANALGAKVAVFGAPAHRNRGSTDEDRAFNLAAIRFRRLGDALSGSGLVLGIEPIPLSYKGDFLQSATEVERMVRMVDHPNIRLHLDTGCVMLGGGNIGDAIRSGADVLAHFQAAEPDLGGFENPRSPHTEAGRALLDSGYLGWVAIEMLEQGPDELGSIYQAASVCRLAYPIAD